MITSAEEALAEIWGTVCPDCGPEEYAEIVAHISAAERDRQLTKDLIREIETYKFECEGGPLGNAVPWIVLKKLLHLVGEERSMPAEAEIAYEAYRRNTGGKSLASGQPIPNWDQLPPAIQRAWGAAAAAVAATVKR